MFSMIFVQSVLVAGRTDADWSSLPMGMLTLLSAATGGEDWMDVYSDFSDQPLYAFLFVFYIIFFTFVVQNTVTSVFVESMFTDKADNDMLIMEERLREKSQYVR